MWAAKFKVYDEHGIYSTRARKFKVKIYGYPLNYYQDKRYFYFLAIGFLEGDKENKMSYMKDMKKEKKIHKLECSGDTFICITKETITKESQRYVHLFYNPLLIHNKPTSIDTEGWEENEIACLNRKGIEDVLRISGKIYCLKLSYVKQQTISDIGIINILPKITEKQKQALEFASRLGYYTHPRKISVKELAKRKNLSFSTFQEHLRKAESRLMPSLIKNVK